MGWGSRLLRDPKVTAAVLQLLARKQPYLKTISWAWKSELDGTRCGGFEGGGYDG